MSAPAPTATATHHQLGFLSGMSYALTQIKNVYLLLRIASILDSQIMVALVSFGGKTAYRQRWSLAHIEQLEMATSVVADNKSVLTNFWMGGRFAVMQLRVGIIREAARKEGFLECLASFDEEFRAVYEKKVKDNGGLPEVGSDWRGQV